MGPKRKRSQTTSSTHNKEDDNNNTTNDTVTKKAKAKTKSKAKSNDTLVNDSFHPNPTTCIIQEEEEGTTKRYWLLKSEPHPHVVNGINISYSIDQMAQDKVTFWNGIRNYAARNSILEMKPNDMAFFYHSNVKVPAIVGIVQITSLPQVDETAFDPNHPFWDAKSTSREKPPRWYGVQVEFVRKLQRQITLKELQQYASSSSSSSSSGNNNNSPLEEMVLLKRGRLSVQPVQPHEWDFVINTLEPIENNNHTETTDTANTKTKTTKVK